MTLFTVRATNRAILPVLWRNPVATRQLFAIVPEFEIGIPRTI
jgi:hypothetical protein